MKNALIDPAKVNEILDERDFRELKRIENLRNSYLESEELVSFTDFGAISPKLNLTAAEMYRGRMIERELSQVARQGIKEGCAHYIFALVKSLQPETVVELGTCLGFSTLMMESAGSSSQIYTIEGADSVRAIAKRNFEDFGKGRIKSIGGRFQDMLPDLLDELESVDFAFIDGHHDGAATLEYFSILNSRRADSAVFVFDDISWSDGMEKAWEEIKNEESVAAHLEVENKLGIIYMERS